MAKILIIGGGFAGLIAAERLAESLDRSHQITLLSHSGRFTFYPALVELAFGDLRADEITIDLASKLSDIGVRFVQGELIRLDKHRKKAEVAGTDIDGGIAYDYVVFALGRRLATEKVRGFFEHSHHLLGTTAAMKFSAAANEFREGDIVLGLCPGGRLPVPVCETAFALARKFEPQVKDGSVRIKVVFPGSLTEAFGGADLHKELEAAFARHHINVLYDIQIVEITEDHVISSEKHEIKHDLLMLIPPFKGQAILNDLGITDKDDFIKVDGLMKVHGMESAYAAGDIVAFSGPKLAHMAVRQGQVAAENLISQLSGKEPETNYYHEIASIIDAGGSDSIYLHYGIWDDSLYRLKQGSFWAVAKGLHDAVWRAKHR